MAYNVHMLTNNERKKDMKKIIAGVVAIALCSTAIAGTIGKAVVGGVVAGAVAGAVVNAASPKQANTPTTQQGNGILLTSTRHTLVCKTYNGYSCNGFSIDSKVDLTPAHFAGKAGYKALWKVSTLVTPDEVYLVLEVSK